MSSADGQSYEVTAKQASTGPELPAGVLRIDAENNVHVEHAEPAFADLLELASTTLNESETFKVRVVPPDAKPFSIHKQAIPRDAPEATAAVVSLLEKTYGLTLRAL